VDGEKVESRELQFRIGHLEERAVKYHWENAIDEILNDIYITPGLQYEQHRVNEYTGRIGWTG
jgi:hypothetical protein